MADFLHAESGGSKNEWTPWQQFFGVIGLLVAAVVLGSIAVQ